MILPPSEKWDTKSKDFVWKNNLDFYLINVETKTNRPTDSFSQSQDVNSSSVLSGSGVISSVSPSATSISNNIQYAVFCSSKQARV